MAKSETTQTAAVANPTPQKLTLHEFCARLSETVSRPELIGAFESFERRSGRAKDSESAYRARFDAFVNTPV